MKIKIKNYEWYYNRPRFPYYWWRPCEWFNSWNWDRNRFPSFASFFCGWLENVAVFLTPWRKPIRQLLDTFVNQNGTKLLRIAPSVASIRTRGENQSYYKLRCGLFRGKLSRTVYIDRRDGSRWNVFGAALCGLTEKEIETREERVLSGWCLTTAQCQRLLDRIVAATPDCEWFSDTSN